MRPDLLKKRIILADTFWKYILREKKKVLKGRSTECGWEVTATILMQDGNGLDQRAEEELMTGS